MKSPISRGRDGFHAVPDQTKNVQGIERSRTLWKASLPENCVRQSIPAVSIVSLLILLSCAAVQANVQQAWIQKYNAELSEGSNQAVAMALDSFGNIIVAGSSQGANGDFDYVTLKYAPNGSKLWVQRYASTNSSDDQVRALALDRDDNVYVTGTSATAKYNALGALEWSAPFGGRALVTDSDGNAYVTGFSDVILPQ